MEKNDEELIGLFKEMRELEKKYNEMPKETLVNILILREVMEDKFEPDGDKVNLWYYVADESGVSYLTNERPTPHLIRDEKTPIFLTNGDVQIRVPKALESMFPQLKPGDEPVKVSLSISF